MDALIDLFTSFSGLLSLAVIAFIFLMAAFFVRLVRNNVEKAVAEQERIAAQATGSNK
ncbi:DUF3149 domain-containing protein [Microbulbifer sp. EKSA008]|uniref:DUF3149 domain-containing protein n=1 Tax=unclassified Microbulbifer TaxID=2619833 RepID=UPI0024ADBF7B|nr:DUF3149 domain-containing protein [Microbulbifer sp. VAAF005]WHI44975.1 DUF3149 domain-containing protein [Microbulbifer sp. VAAF005]WNZ56256.1 DUF3149 domain-containing protein [Microbulbifer sp. MKSA007]